MKVQIKSKQDYGTHTEEIEEEIEAFVNRTSERIKIKWENGQIVIEKGKIIQRKNGNEMIIEVGKQNECKYKTKQGILELTTNGVSIEKFDKGKVLGKAEYHIQIARLNPYKNELIITCLD